MKFSLAKLSCFAPSAWWCTKLMLFLVPDQHHPLFRPHRMAAGSFIIIIVVTTPSTCPQERTSVCSSFSAAQTFCLLLEITRTGETFPETKVAPGDGGIFCTRGKISDEFYQGKRATAAASHGEWYEIRISTKWIIQNLYEFWIKWLMWEYEFRELPEITNK